MWPGQQPPGGEQNPQDPSQNPYQQPGYQTPNPYQQPGYQTPNPYQQQQQPGGAPQWNPPAPLGSPEPPPGNDRKKTTVIAIVAATAVVIAAGVTGFIVLGGDDKDDKKDEAKGGGDKSSSAPKAPKPTQTEEGNPRDGSGGEKATVPGWKVVLNPKHGTAFDVPPEWDVKSPGWMTGFEDDKGKAGDPPLVIMSAPAFLKEKWCSDDADKDGKDSDTSLAATGTKGANGAKNAEESAVNQVPWWVYGGYTQPDKKSMTFDKKGKTYTNKQGTKGVIARAHSTDSPEIGKSKCATDGKAVTFGFKNNKGDFVVWNFHGAKGVKEEVPDKTVMKILDTVRPAGEPTG